MYIPFGRLRKFSIFSAQVFLSLAQFIQILNLQESYPRSFNVCTYGCLMLCLGVLAELFLRAYGNQAPNNLRGILYPYILTIFSNHLLSSSSRYVLSGSIPICLKIFLFHLLDPVLRTYVRRSIDRSRRTTTTRKKQHQHPPHEMMLPISSLNGRTYRIKLQWASFFFYWFDH